jgi:predicted deacylase
VEEDAVALTERGVAGVMKHLGMRDEGPSPIANAKWVSRDAVLRAGVSGLFYAAVEPEQMVTKGALLGHITDFHGHTVEDFHAPFDGEVMYVIGTPPISKGEPVVMVGSDR